MKRSHVSLSSQETLQTDIITLMHTHAHTHTFLVFPVTVKCPSTAAPLLEKSINTSVQIFFVSVLDLFILPLIACISVRLSLPAVLSLSVFSLESNRRQSLMLSFTPRNQTKQYKCQKLLNVGARCLDQMAAASATGHLPPHRAANHSSVHLCLFPLACLHSCHVFLILFSPHFLTISPTLPQRVLKGGCVCADGHRWAI